MNVRTIAAVLVLLTSGFTLASENEPGFYAGFDYTHFLSDNDRQLDLAPLANVDDGNGLGAFVGYDFSDFLGLRLSYKDIDASSQGFGAYDVDGDILSFDGLFSPFEFPVYLTAGLNRLEFENKDTAVSFGLGYKHAITEKLSAFAEAKRYLAFSDSLNSDVTLSLGLSYHFGTSSSKATKTNNDHDNDGVLNHLDQCPNSLANAVVDAKGCADSDNDGVVNSLDACPATPAGAYVNKDGCQDSDRDGIADTKDLCPGSVRSAPVDQSGCADDDKDGVNNKHDLCPNSKPGAVVAETGCETTRETIELSILFDNNSSVIKSSYNADLEKVASYLKRHPETDVKIIGHTSSVGNADYNQHLSEKRAKTVAQTLIQKHGISNTRVSWEGKGEQALKHQGNSAEAHRLNRRIEAIFN